MACGNSWPPPCSVGVERMELALVLMGRTEIPGTLSIPMPMTVATASTSSARAATPQNPRPASVESRCNTTTTK